MHSVCGKVPGAQVAPAKGDAMICDLGNRGVRPRRHLSLGPVSPLGKERGGGENVSASPER